MNLLRDSSDLQVKKAVNILQGTVIKGKMNVSYLHTSKTEALKMIYKPTSCFSLNDLCCCIVQRNTKYD